MFCVILLSALAASLHPLPDLLGLKPLVVSLHSLTLLALEPAPLAVFLAIRLALFTLAHFSLAGIRLGASPLLSMQGSGGKNKKESQILE